MAEYGKRVKKTLHFNPIVPKASIYVPKVMCKKQSKCGRFRKLAQTVNINMEHDG